MNRIPNLLFSVISILSLLVFGLPASGCQLLPGTPSPTASSAALHLYGTDPLTLDPAISGEMPSHEFVLQIFSGLVRLGDNLEPVPDIAQRWQVNSDGMIYTFYLRQDVRFQDGRQVKAAPPSNPRALRR